MANAVTYTKLWDPLQIGTSATTIYTAEPASSSGVVKNISAVICNTTTSPATVSIWVIPSGGASGDSNQLIDTETIPANSRLSFSVPDMANGDVLSGLAGTVSSLTIHCTSGIVIN